MLFMSAEINCRGLKADGILFRYVMIIRAKEKKGAIMAP